MLPQPPTPTSGSPILGPGTTPGEAANPFAVFVAPWAFALLLAIDPSIRGGSVPELMHLSAGIGLALIAWRGAFGAMLLAATGPVLGAVVLVQQVILGRIHLGTVLGTVLDPMVLTIELLFAWHLYSRSLHGSRRLIDPRSAILFLIVVVGLVPFAVAPLQAGLQMLWLPGDPAFLVLCERWWLATALGLLVLGPPLLVLAPGWFPAAEGHSEKVDDIEALAHTMPDIQPPSRGDWIETIGLSLAAGLLGLILVLARPNEDAAWPLWGGTLLLAVWASLRQGLRGGTLAASFAALLPLLAVQIRGLTEGTYMLQASLLAQSAVALLVASTFTWIRYSEARYRQVVGHVAIVLYSARILPTPTSKGGRGSGLHGRIPRAEVTLVSSASVHLLDCPPTELLGDHSRWLAHVHPQDREVVQAALVQLALQKQPVVCEYRLMPVDGEVEKTPSKGYRWLRDTLAPRFDSAGKLVGWDGVVTDVTEQRVLADDLRRTTSMFHVLVTNLPAGIFFIQGSTGRPLLVNARARQLLGQREDSTAGLAHLSMVYRLFRQDGTPYPVEELPVYQALKFGRTTMRDDIVVHRPDGRRVSLVTWAAPVRMSNQSKEDAAVWVLEDLTALHQAEAARRETEVRLRAIIETMGEGLIVLDRRGLIADCNSAASTIFQLSAEHMRGRGLDGLPWRLLDEDDKPLAPEASPVAEVLRTHKPVRNVVIGLQPEDSGAATHWLLLNAMPLGSAEVLSGVVVTVADITAPRQAREVLRVSEERYRGLVETLPLMLVQCDTTLQVEYINPAFTRISGYETAEVRDPAFWMKLIHPDDMPRVQESLTGALAGQIQRFEFRYRAKEGEAKVGYAMVQPRWQEGQIVGTIGVILDLTRERQLELELQRSQRLELIGRLSSGVAHDFNNLLTVVMNLSSLSLEDLPDDHPVQENLRQISAASEQAARLAGQLLELSRQQRVAPTTVDLNRVARRTLELVRALLPETIALTTALSEGELLVRADETQLQQVLFNLCLHARDSMPEGGVLTIATLREAGRVLLSVAEEGPSGVANLPDRTEGLGLFVVQQILEASGGRIETLTDSGRGSRFEVSLPVA